MIELSKIHITQYNFSAPYTQFCSALAVRTFALKPLGSDKSYSLMHLSIVVSKTILAIGVAGFSVWSLKYLISARSTDRMGFTNFKLC